MKHATLFAVLAATALLPSPASAFTLIESRIIDAISEAVGDAMVVDHTTGERGEIDLGPMQITPTTAPAGTNLRSDLVLNRLNGLLELGLVDNVLSEGIKSGYLFSLESTDPFSMWEAPAVARDGGSNPRVMPVDSYNLIFDFEIEEVGVGTWTWHLDEGPGQNILIENPSLVVTAPGVLELSFEVTPGPGFDPDLPFVTLEGIGSFQAVPEPSRAALLALGLLAANLRRPRNRITG